MPPSSHFRLPIFCHFLSDNKVLQRLNLRAGGRTKGLLWWRREGIGRESWYENEGRQGGEVDGRAKWRGKEMMAVMRNTAQEGDEWVEIAGRLGRKRAGYQKKTWG